MNLPVRLVMYFLKAIEAGNSRCVRIAALTGINYPERDRQAIGFTAAWGSSPIVAALAMDDLPSTAGTIAPAPGSDRW
jgi:hypothetical protein